MTQPISSNGFRPFKKDAARPVALPQAPARKGQPNSAAPPASPHMSKHRPQPNKPTKLVIADATPEAPFGFDEHGNALTATEFANRRLARTDPNLPQVPTQQRPSAQNPGTAGMVRKYGEPVPLDLPSGYVFNSEHFNSLYVRPIRGHNMAMFASAWANRSKREEVRATSSVLETDTQFPDVAYQLTLGDYYWLLYRLRFTNYRRPIRHTDMCQSEEHQKMVRSGKIPRKSLLIETPLVDGMMEEKSLTVLPQYDSEIMYSEDLRMSITLRPAVMLDMIETLEHDNFGKDPRWDYLSQLACYIQALTYAERMEIANALTPDQIEHMQAYEKVLNSYGMVERIQVKCAHCGHEQEAKVTIDASTFLPG